MTKIAVSQIKALHVLAEYGVLNELNAQAIFDEMCLELKAPAHGYFYAEDVCNFAESLIERALS